MNIKKKDTESQEEFANRAAGARCAFLIEQAGVDLRQHVSRRLKEWYPDINPEVHECLVADALMHFGIE